MLEAAASRADVNVYWLLTGQGEPLAAPGRSVGGIFWPVATQLLPGEPGQYPELLSHVTLPAASPYLLESAYWLEVTTAAPIAHDSTSRIAAGDYLLIETAPRWTCRPEAYLGRLIALRTPDSKEIILGRSGRHEEGSELVQQHVLKTYPVFAEARLFPLHTRVAAQREEPESLWATPDVVRFYGDDVVGVVLQRTSFLDARDRA